jgi:co-chaperonin GroES (HSP10)
MAIKPILHRIIVKQDKLEDKDDAFKAAKAMGIIIHTDERKREQAAIDTGTVVSIGPTAFKDFGVDPAPISVGDVVVYAKYGGKAVKDPKTNEEFVALNDEDVIAIFTE